MSLPKRNPLIKVLYGSLILLMLVFLGWTYTEPFMAEASGLKEAEAPQQNLFHVNKQRIAGLQTTIILDDTAESQINKAWEDLFQKKVAEDLKVEDKLKVYAVYYYFNLHKNRVQLILGYPVDKNTIVPFKLSSIDIPADDYIRVEDGLVLESWNHSEKFSQPLKYEKDFEVYELNNFYKVKNQTAYLSVQ